MICRVCLQTAECALNIFDTNGVQLNIAEIILQHFWFKPLPDDPVSSVICRDCWVKVNEFHQFYVTVEQAHENLHRVMMTEDEVKAESTEELKALMNVEVCIKKEMGDDLDTDLSLVPNPLDNPLYEPEMPDDLVNMESADAEEAADEENKSDQISVNTSDKRGNDKNIHIVDDDDDDDDDDEDRDDDKDESYKEEDDDEEEEFVNLRKRRLETKKTRKTVTKRSKVEKVKLKKLKTETDSTIKKKKQPRLKWMESTHKDEEMIKKHIPMGCDMCHFVGTDFADMTQHFRVSHPGQRPYVKCCDRKLGKRFLLVQHAYKHEDPNFFWCHECQRSFSDNYVLRSHMLANHAPEEELAFSCDKCPRRFPRQYLLDLHTPSHIPMEERKFLCSKCPQPKAFASEHLLQIHINMRHTKAINVCHVCAKEIRDNQAFEKHVRLHFEDSGPRVKCPRPGCDRWLKDEDNLKQHMRRHNDEGKVFTCQECGKSCKNRRSLTSHLHYSHSKQTFECEVCQKKFKRAITLKEHMAQHTGQALYKCPFCERTFNSNANMHSHKKKMHPIEWEHWRRTKRGSSQQVLTNDSMRTIIPPMLHSSLDMDQQFE